MFLGTIGKVRFSSFIIKAKIYTSKCIMACCFLEANEKIIPINDLFKKLAQANRGNRPQSENPPLHLERAKNKESKGTIL